MIDYAWVDFRGTSMLILRVPSMQGIRCLASNFARKARVPDICFRSGTRAHGMARSYRKKTTLRGHYRRIRLAARRACFLSHFTLPHACAFLWRELISDEAGDCSALVPRHIDRCERPEYRHAHYSSRQHTRVTEPARPARMH